MKNKQLFYLAGGVAGVIGFIKYRLYFKSLNDLIIEHQTLLDQMAQVKDETLLPAMIKKKDELEKYIAMKS